MRITEEEYLTAVEVVKGYKEQIKLDNIINVKIINIEMTARLFNCIKDWISRGGDLNSYRPYLNIDSHYISYFENIDLNQFKKVRNLGTKSLLEFERILNDNNIDYIKPRSYYFS